MIAVFDNFIQDPELLKEIEVKRKASWLATHATIVFIV